MSTRVRKTKETIRGRELPYRAKKKQRLKSRRSEEKDRIVVVVEDGASKEYKQVAIHKNVRYGSKPLSKGQQKAYDNITVRNTHHTHSLFCFLYRILSVGQLAKEADQRSTSHATSLSVFFPTQEHYVIPDDLETNKRYGPLSGSSKELRLISAYADGSLKPKNTSNPPKTICYRTYPRLTHSRPCLSVRLHTSNATDSPSCLTHTPETHDDFRLWRDWTRRLDMPKYIDKTFFLNGCVCFKSPNPAKYINICIQVYES